MCHADMELKLSGNAAEDQPFMTSDNNTLFLSLA